jgi:hypothetical protein
MRVSSRSRGPSVTAWPSSFFQTEQSRVQYSGHSNSQAGTRLRPSEYDVYDLILPSLRLMRIVYGPGPNREVEEKILRRVLSSITTRRS